MGGFGEFFAHVFESGSVTQKGHSADARMIRYGASYYPENVGIELVVLDLEDYRQDARLAEPRLAIELEEVCINLDCALQTKSSENGRRLFDIRNEQLLNERSAYRIEGNPDEIDQQGNNVKSKEFNGNKNYR